MDRRVLNDDFNELRTHPGRPKRKPQQSARLTYPYGRHSESEYLNAIKHKTVIIVGPAGYLQGQGKGAWIDSFDLVARVNHAIPIAFPEDYGSRTDVLYHILSHRGDNHKKICDRKEIETWRDHGLKWLISRHTAVSKRVRDMGPIINGAFPWACMHHVFYGKLKQAIGSKTPNTGISAIMHMLSVPIKSLTITGFDLYQTGVYPGYGDVQEGEDPRKVNDIHHDVDAQIEYLVRVIKRDNRIHIDDHLKEVLGL